MTRLNFPDPAASPYTENGITYVWNANGGGANVGFWEATGGAINLQTVTDAGNTTTNGATFEGQVTVGSTITLRSTGSANFSGSIRSNAQINSDGSMTVAGNPNAGGAVGVSTLDTGKIQAATASGYLFRGYTQGDSTVQAQINADGTAAFAGNITQGGFNKSDFGADGNNLVIGTTGAHAGMTILSGTDKSSAIHFADGTSGDARFRGIYKYNHNDDRFEWATAGANNRMFLDSTGKLILVGTGSVPGIQFGSTNSGGDITSQTLDDYEEGTWTPTFTDATADAAGLRGQYTKIGDVVFISAAGVGLTVTTGGVDARITNLPFPVRNLAGNNTNYAAAVTQNNYAPTSNTGFFQAGTNIFNFQQTDNNMNAADTDNTGGTKQVFVSGFYRTDA